MKSDRQDEGYRGTPKKIDFYLILAILVLSAGCASVASVLVTGAGSGIQYTFTNVAYKTVGYPIGEVQSALHRALEKMGIKELTMQKGDNKLEIHAETIELEIIIDLESVTNMTTRITVDARKNVLLKDKATAAAIVEQTEIILSRESNKAPESGGINEIHNSP